MPRYHFDLTDDGDDLDEDGSELPDAPAARKVAVTIALDEAVSRPPIDGRAPSVVTIRDAVGRTVHRVWVQVHERPAG